MRLRVMTESCPLTSHDDASPLACDDDASSCDERIVSVDIEDDIISIGVDDDASSCDERNRVR